MTKKIAENMKSAQQANTNGDEVEAYTISIFNKYTGKMSVSDVTTEAPSVTTPCSLKCIIKRAKNAKNILRYLALQVSSTQSMGSKLIMLERTITRSSGGAHEYEQKNSLVK